MKLKMTLRLFLLTIMLALLWSCRADDFAAPQSESKRNNNDFFKHSKKESAYARSGVDYVDILESYNKEKDFLSTMPDQEGKPIWDKMQVLDGDNTTGLMIPLSVDNETLSSVLFAILDDRNTVTGVKDYDNALLERIVYDGKIDAKFRESMFNTFMFVDNKTFGTQEFTGLPIDLFKDRKYDDKYGRIEIKSFEEPQKAVVDETGKFLWIEDCYKVWACSHHGEGTCDKCDALCHKIVCGSIAIYIGNESDFPPTTGTPNNGGGGGGGGGTPSIPTQQPPKDPCTVSISRGAFYRLNTGCLGTGGDIDLPPNPCRKLKDLLDPTKANLKPLITGGMYNHINNSTGEGGIYLIKDAAGNITTEVAPYTAGSSIPIKSSGLYYAAMHTHPKSAYAMFSWTDIYNLYLLEMNAALPFNNGMSSFLLVCEDDNGVKQTYAIVFEGIGTMMEDILNNPENNGCTAEEIRKRMDLKLEEKFDEEAKKTNPNYERVFLQFNFGTNIGLYKANSDLTNWSKLSINENTNTAIVNSVNCN